MLPTLLRDGVPAGLSSRAASRATCSGWRAALSPPCCPPNQTAFVGRAPYTRTTSTTELSGIACPAVIAHTAAARTEIQARRSSVLGFAAALVLPLLLPSVGITGNRADPRQSPQTTQDGCAHEL
jgi:hypothetical protein